MELCIQVSPMYLNRGPTLSLYSGCPFDRTLVLYALEEGMEAPVIT